MNSNSNPTVIPSPPPRMPHVFVIPPEEEQQENPPWCCFDANELPNDSGDCLLDPNPDIHLFNVPYHSIQEPEQQPQVLGTPIFRVGSISNIDPSVKFTTPKKLAKKQRPEAVRIVERRGDHRDVREDSDVIEVVKVKRSKDALTDPEEYTKMKRSKTFKARATKALQSIKNVGRSSRKQHVKDMWTSSESVPGVFKGLQEQIRQQQEQLHPQPFSFPAKGHPSLSRSNSRSLSQMFQSAMSFCSTSPFHPSPPSSPTSPPAYVKNTNTMPTICEALSPEPISDRSDSPSPSVKSNKRFSVRELHKIFMFSSSSPDDPLPPLPTMPRPPVHNDSVPSPSASTASSSYPDIPVEGAYPSIHFLDFDNVDRKLTGSPHQAIIDDDDDYGTLLSRRQRDLSFEMKLDSLHFDSLSFDPEGFNVSMDRNVRR
ncbi:hypothetical protein V8B97DRAFT_1868505 [Scleroderma yunnanense]